MPNKLRIASPFMKKGPRFVLLHERNCSIKLRQFVCFLKIWNLNCAIYKLIVLGYSDSYVYLIAKKFRKKETNLK